LKIDDKKALALFLPGLVLFVLEDELKEALEMGRIKIPKSTEGMKHLPGGLVGVRLLHNTGVARGALGRHPALVKHLSVGLTAAAGCIWGAFLSDKKMSRLDVARNAGMSALLAGALSNTKDRVTRGYVVDYFSFLKGPQELKNLVFNLSDMGILIGAAVAATAFSIDKAD